MSWEEERIKSITNTEASSETEYLSTAFHQKEKKKQTNPLTMTSIQLKAFQHKSQTSQKDQGLGLRQSEETGAGWTAGVKIKSEDPRKIIESWNGFGWEGSSGTSSTRSCWFKSYPAWPWTLQKWRNHSFPEKICQCLTTLTLRNFFLISDLHSSSFSLEPCPFSLKCVTEGLG